MAGLVGGMAGRQDLDDYSTRDEVPEPRDSRENAKLYFHLFEAGPAPGMQLLTTLL